MTSNLVQVDAVVLNAKGKQVTDLRPEEFELLEDGRPQVITNFSYVNARPAPGAAPPPGEMAAKDGTAGSNPSGAEPDHALSAPRSFVVVVDDLALSNVSAAITRQALRRFVDEQLRPGDQVVISHTRRGTGTYQKLTADRQTLHDAIDSIIHRCPNRVEPCVPSDPSYPARSRAESLKALKLVLTKMHPMSGRKSLIFFSDDFVITPQPDDARFSEGSPMEKDLVRAVERMGREGPRSADEARMPDAPYGEAKQVIDLANRASVVIYTMDPRGLVASAPGLSDVTSGQPLHIAKHDPEWGKLLSTQDGLRMLAEETGGRLTYNTNDLSRGTALMLEDLRGFYLLGYRPGEETLARDGVRQRFYRLRIRVKRPGLTVRARRGFYNVPDEQRRPHK